MSVVPSTQKALLLLKAHGDYAVQEVEVYKPGAGELLIEIHAAGLNPVDWKRQSYGMFIKTFPAILGSDASGVVKQIGEGVTDFSVGDKVVFQGYFVNRQATFQQYVINPAEITAKIPSNITFDQAATIPLAFTTAAFGLYGEKIPFPGVGGAGLVAPWEKGGRGKYAGQPILVIGGSSAVGQQALSLAKISGFSPIITTAPLKNEALVKSLGATHVIDRKAPLQESVRAITELPLNIVYDAISDASTQLAAYNALAPGGTFVLVLAPEIPNDQLDSTKTIVKVVGTVHDPTQKEIGRSLYSNLASLIESGDIKPNNIEILPNGLAGIPAGLDRLKRGEVSATKLIARPLET